MSAFPPLPPLPPIAGTIAARLGPPAGRNVWHCPFHDDRHPSLSADVRRNRFRCWSSACGAKGDPIDFVRRYEDLGFVEALDALGIARPGGQASESVASAPRSLSRGGKALDASPERSQAEWRAAARPIVSEAAAALWAPEGRGALSYLRGRGLADDTIRAARLGHVPESGRIGGQKCDAGVCIPWHTEDGELLTLKVRRPAGSRPKYRAFKGGRGGFLYPNSGIVEPGRPVVLVEGELDCLLLGQALNGLIAVCTIGSASTGLANLDPAARLALASASVWYVAMDNDAAGDAAAEALAQAAPSKSRRVRPPVKDWTDVHLAGYDLRCWWLNFVPDLTTDNRAALWSYISTWRWGVADESPGVIFPLEQAR